MDIDIKHKEQEFFAVIKDIDIKNLSNEDFLKIKDIIETYGVVVLKSQIISDDDQILFSKKFGKLDNVNFCYIGDGNNVASSLSLLCGHLGINFTYSSPSKYQIPQYIFKQSKSLSRKNESAMNWEENPDLAVKNADIIYTDKWVSMGMEEESEIRIKDFKNYQVNKKLISLANNEVLIMHDMPAKEGEEIENGILDSPISLAFEQAENRMHSQTALLYKLYS